MSKNKRVLIRAPLLTVSGYGVHSRQIFKWLMGRSDFDVTVQVLKWGNTSWLVNPELEDGLIGKIMSKSSPPSGVYDMSFQVQLPDEWDVSLAKFNVGITAAVETDKCNSEWADSVNKMDLVIVPSTHVKKTLEQSGDITTKIIVIHESFYDEIITEDKDHLGLELSTNFNFLIVGQLTGDNPGNDRKNIFNTLKWMCEIFKDDKDVGIILKTNHGKNTKIDRQLTKKLINSLVKEVRKGEYPKIHLIHGHLTPNEMSSIYKMKNTKCFVSLTRGEGFGLPLLESAACGLPIIATNWSGHLDFLRRGKFIPVNYVLSKIPEGRVDNRIFIKDTKWAEAIESDFKKKIQKFRVKSEIPTAWAKSLMETIRSEFSQDAICNTYDCVIDEEYSLLQSTML
jgi:glycosyltransferase involved in cell wall biosynthesis